MSTSHCSKMAEKHLLSPGKRRFTPEVCHSSSEIKVNSKDSLDTLHNKNKQRKLDTMNSSGNNASKQQRNSSEGCKLDTRLYLNWENASNICWLNAAVSLLVHNQTLRKLKENRISYIIKKYDEAMDMLNDDTDKEDLDRKMNDTKRQLENIQKFALQFLQPKLKYKEGEPDSAFCCLYNLVTENKAVRNCFDVGFCNRKICDKCGKQKNQNRKKPIITLSNCLQFEPTLPISVCQCSICKEPDQKMMLFYKTLPPCLVFHFENGAGKGELQLLDFMIGKRTYKMTGVMMMETDPDSPVNHFVTWVRNPLTDCWLECNDLNMEVVNFTLIPPVLDLKEVHILMYEATDDLGTVENSTECLNTAETIDSGKDDFSNDADVPIIVLSDDEDTKTGSNSTENKGIRRFTSTKYSCTKEETILPKTNMPDQGRTSTNHQPEETLVNSNAEIQQDAVSKTEKEDTRTLSEILERNIDIPLVQDQLNLDNSEMGASKINSNEKVSNSIKYKRSYRTRKDTTKKETDSEKNKSKMPHEEISVNTNVNEVTHKNKKIVKEEKEYVRMNENEISVKEDKCNTDRDNVLSLKSNLLSKSPRASAISMEKSGTTSPRNPSTHDHTNPGSTSVKKNTHSEEEMPAQVRHEQLKTTAKRVIPSEKGQFKTESTKQLIHVQQCDMHCQCSKLSGDDWIEIQSLLAEANLLSFANRISSVV